ncbi:hypothetical protein HDU67_005620, partial [Dinochytrium kinnereticum]
GIFSQEQLVLLRIQTQQNVQIASQAYTIERELRGEEAEDSRYWRTQLLKLKENRDYGYRVIGTSTFHDSPVIQHIDRIVATSDRTKSKASKEFRKSLGYQLTSREKRDIDIRLLREGNERKRHATNLYPAPLFDQLEELIQLAGLAFDSNLIPRIMR